MRAMNQGWSRLLLGVVVLGLALLGLGCKEVVGAPTSLVYATNPATHVVGVTITPNRPTSSGGAIDSYAVSPSLPTGLSLDTKTGIISGTPSAITATASYTVTATNVTGSTTASLSITITDLAPSDLTYSDDPAVYTQGTAIPANSPISAGGAVLSYSVSPTLPLGLSLNTTTGVISGTPTAITAAASYTVTATNSGGSTSTSLSITVNGPALTLTTQPASQSILVGQTALFSVTAAGSGTLSYQWLKGGVAIAGATSSSYTTPAAILADNGTAFKVQVSDSSGASVTSTTATLTVASPTLIITTQPASQSILVGQTAQFSVVASGPGQITYQWLKGGVAIAGATSSSYTTPTAILADNGTAFRVQVSDSSGASVTSTTATLTVAAVASGSGSFIATTSSLAAPRAFHTATLLSSGKVLLAGGQDASSSLQTAELFDPAVGTFSATGSLSAARYNHSATNLADGRVLIIGGVSLTTTLASAELYDPATGKFTATGSLLAARSDHTATLLGSGKVLVVGGRDLTAYPATAELWDPATGVFTATTGAPISPRATHTASLLASGKVLLAAGYRASALATAELYDPTAGTFTATGSLNVARAYQTATTLANGKVLLVGGAAAAAELYDPAAGTFVTTGSLLIARASWHAAALLPTGKVLVVGGIGTGTQAVSLSEAELFDPATGLFTSTGSMTTERIAHTASVLLSGKVLVVGGVGTGYLASAELYY
jgi:Putative Ig domain/Galactose oxidase, central domain